MDDDGCRCLPGGFHSLLVRYFSDNGQQYSGGQGATLSAEPLWTLDFLKLNAGLPVGLVDFQILPTQKREFTAGSLYRDNVSAHKPLFSSSKYHKLKKKNKNTRNSVKQARKKVHVIYATSYCSLQPFFIVCVVLSDCTCVMFVSRVDMLHLGGVLGCEI